MPSCLSGQQDEGMIRWSRRFTLRVPCSFLTNTPFAILMMVIAFTNHASFRVAVNLLRSNQAWGRLLSLDGRAIPLSPWAGKSLAGRCTGRQENKGCKGWGDVSHRRCCDWAVIGSLSRLYPFILTSVSFNFVAHCVFNSLCHSFSYTASHSLVHLRKSVVVKSLLSS